MAELEFSLLGQSNKERQIALEYRRIELKLAKELRDIDALSLDAQKKADLRQRATDLAELEKSAAASKAQLAEASDFVNGIDSAARETFRSVAKEGVDAFERIGDSLQSAVLDGLYQMTTQR